MALKKGSDHWDFLEEIEAPMWVDLTLEAKSNNRDVDDEWFRISHQIHQCSSRKVKSALSYLGEDSVEDSISKSRGKEYKIKKWREDDCKLFSNKQRSVKVLNEPKSGFSKSKGTLETRLVRESASTERSKANHSKPKSFSCDSMSSTVTSLNNQQQQQSFPEVTKLETNNDIRLLEVMRISLRKSCATRQPSRVEVNNDKRESNGGKSLSGKSSVGSSCNPGHDVKNLTVSSRMVKEITPDSKNVVSKTSTFRLDKSRMVDKKKLVYQDAAKSKVSYQKLHSKSLAPILDGKDSLTAATKGDTKVVVGGPNGLNRALAAGKENAIGKMAVNPSAGGRDMCARGMVWGPKGIKHNALQKEKKTGQFPFKGKISDQNKKKPTNTMQRPHFR